MEGMNQETVWPDVRLDKAQSCWRQSIRRGKAVRDRGSLAVILQFLVHIQEHVRWQLFHLVTHVIGHEIPTLDRLVPTALETAMESLVTVGQGLPPAGDDFRNDQVSGLESYQVAGVTDMNTRRVFRLSDLIVLPDIEQFRME